MSTTVKQLDPGLLSTALDLSPRYALLPLDFIQPP